MDNVAQNIINTDNGLLSKNLSPLGLIGTKRGLILSQKMSFGRF